MPSPESHAQPAKPLFKGFGKPARLYEAGLRHLRAGAHLDAQLCCEQALAMDPHHADTMHLMGLITLHANRHDLAVEWISRAIRQEPKPEYLTSLGHTLLKQGRGEEALKTFDKATLKCGRVSRLKFHVKHAGLLLRGHQINLVTWRVVVPVGSASEKMQSPATWLAAAGLFWRCLRRRRPSPAV